MDKVLGIKMPNSGTYFITENEYLGTVGEYINNPSHKPHFGEHVRWIDASTAIQKTSAITEEEIYEMLLLLVNTTNPHDLWDKDFASYQKRRQSFKIFWHRGNKYDF